MADPRWTHLVRVTEKIVPLLVNALDGGALLDSLVSRGCISQAQYDQSRRNSKDLQTSPEDVARDLLTVLRSSSPCHFDSFLAVLQLDESRKALLHCVASATDVAHESERLPCEYTSDEISVARKRALGNVNEVPSDSPSKSSRTEILVAAQARESDKVPDENTSEKMSISRKRSPATVEEGRADPPSKYPRTDFPDFAFIYVHEELKDVWEPNRAAFVHMVTTYCTAVVSAEKKINVSCEYVPEMTIVQKRNRASKCFIDRDKCLLRICLPETTPEIFEEYQRKLLRRMTCELNIAEESIEISPGSCYLTFTLTGKRFITFVCGLHASRSFAHLVVLDSLGEIQFGSFSPVKIASFLRFGRPKSVSEVLFLFRKVRLTQGLEDVTHS